MEPRRDRPQQPRYNPAARPAQPAQEKKKKNEVVPPARRAAPRAEHER
jgi:hypothetical protein